MHSGNRAQTAISECDREPIHIPGSIQPHGLLMALHPTDLTVVQIAGDSLAFLGVPPQQLLHESLSARLGVAALARLQLLAAQATTTPRPAFLFQVTAQGDTLDVSAHLSGGLVVLEFMRRLVPETNEPIELVQSMTAAIRSAASVSQLLDRIAFEVQQASGFDRVMIYRFDQDGSGRVEAEQRGGESVDSYLGLAYPASDIPQQARRLYLQNWIRCIPDIHYRAVPIEPQINPLTGAPLDLTHSALRSVSPIHLQYLSNMGVAASMSLSIIVEGRLWGLIACHHYQPRYLNSSAQSALELFAQLASMQLTTTLALERARQDAFRRNIQGELLVALAEDGFPTALKRNSALLMEFMNATGVAIHAQGNTSLHGVVPPAATVDKIIAWLNSRPMSRVWATDRLSQIAAELTIDGHEVAGVLAVSISRLPRDYVLWFLPELRTTVRWAGNPHKAVGSAPGNLTPRTSFAAWSEEIIGRSRPWLDDELAAANRLRVDILESALVHLDELARDRDAASRRQDLLMRELDHRVKNILATIQSVVRFSGKSADTLSDFIRGLEQRLISMAKAHDLLTSARWVGASLHRLINDELAPFVANTDSRFSVAGDDVLLVPSAALALSLALHELATNAAKYGSLSVPRGMIVVTCERVSGPGGIELVNVHWAEHKGPPVAKPTRKGFGRLLLEKIYENDPGGIGIRLHFEPNGVKCDISLRADRTLAGEAHAEAEPAKTFSQNSLAARINLSGLKVLLVEDNPIVAMDVAEIIVTAGGSLSGPYLGLEESMAAVARDTFDVALLDVDLGGVFVWPLAQAIKARDIPIVFTTGFSDAGLWPGEFIGATTIHKPYDHHRLLRKLQRATSGSA